eukprot:scaffold41598_cov32-Phaeocystis_antarctica.AAC.3
MHPSAARAATLSERSFSGGLGAGVEATPAARVSETSHGEGQRTVALRPHDPFRTLCRLAQRHFAFGSRKQLAV